MLGLHLPHTHTKGLIYCTQCVILECYLQIVTVQRNILVVCCHYPYVTKIHTTNLPTIHTYPNTTEKKGMYKEHIHKTNAQKYTNTPKEYTYKNTITKYIPDNNNHSKTYKGQNNLKMQTYI